MDRVIEFFKSMNLYNEDYFNYLKNNTKIINIPYSEIIDFVGCYKVDDGCRLILPKINSFEDELIYVHEYSHALFPDDDLEIFPNLMEAIYINKYLDEFKKEDLINKLKSDIIKTIDENHLVGKKIKLMSIDNN